MPAPIATRDLFLEQARTVTVDLVSDPWGTSILLVSGQPTAQQELEGRLAGGGESLFQITHAARWQSGLQALENQEFSAILLDTEALDVDPRQALGLLRRVSRGTPVFMLTETGPTRALPQALSKSQLDRRGLLKRIRVRSRRRAASSSEAIVAQDVMASGTKSRDLVVQTALRALKEGRMPESLAVKYEPVRSMSSVLVKALRGRVVLCPEGKPEVAPQILAEHAQASGRALDIWRWALNEACARVARGPQSLVTLPMGLDLGDHSLVVGHVARALATHNLRGQNLQLELHEADVMRAPEAATTWASEFGLIGVRTSLVGVGGGMSSFSLLARLRPARIEVDASLVARVHTCKEAAAAVAAIVASSGQLGAISVGAGVQSELQADALRTLGCAQVRGPWVTSGGTLP